MSLIIFLLSFIASAQTSTKCDFTIKCDNFSLEFKSPTGDCTEDDTNVSRVVDGQKEKFPIEAAWFYDVLNVSNPKSSCSSSTYGSYPAFDVGAAKLIFVRKNGRPGHDLILALLVDTKTGAFLHQLDLGAYMRNTLGILKSKRGFRLRVVSGFIKEMNCDCDAALEESWLEVRVHNNKITKHWIK
jgi:hypothetical protein